MIKIVLHCLPNELDQVGWILDQLKRLRGQLEKQANQLKTDNDEMTNELKTVSGSKAENERKRKGLKQKH